MLWDTAFVLVCDYKTSECVGKVLVLLGIQTRNRFINTSPIPPINDTDYRLYGLLLYVSKKVHLPDGFRQNVVHDEPAPLRADQFLAASRAAPFVAGHLLPG